MTALRSRMEIRERGVFAVSGGAGSRPTLRQPLAPVFVTAQGMPRGTVAILFALCIALLSGCVGSPVSAPSPFAERGDGQAAFRVAKAQDAQPQQDAGWRQALQAFRDSREASLRSPDGWMALVGLHWLPPGELSVGSAEDSAVRLAVGPARLGWIEVLPTAMAARLRLDPAAKVLGNGETVDTDVMLVHADKAEVPTRLDFDGGSLGLIERGGRFALRVRSPQAPTLLAFKALRWFEADPRLVATARFEQHEAGRTIPIVNVLGQIEPTPNPGRLHFELEGTALTLEALGDPDDALFLIFADRTNARESYGAGRFLYTAKVVDGRVELDFNRSINPPCAYTEFSTCPLPPPENRLRAFIRAGEARYGHTSEAPAS
jgi:uncharacterized protein (DUF1684 family)